MTLQRSHGTKRSADAAHELLTPLAVIKANLETIEDRALAAALSADVDETIQIVSQLLELSEIESEERPPDMPCDLRRIANEVLMRLAPLAIRQGLETSLTGADGPVRVRGCPKALATAIGNLVNNTIQHAHGATRLEVRVEEGGRLSVIDDGPGIPPKLRERIFERFHRAPGAGGAGKGLGLAIVGRIAAAHGGRAHVTDGPGGKGAAFVIELPAEGDAGAEPGGPQRPAAASSPMRA